MRQKKTAQITFRIDPNLKEAAGKAAALERRSLTSLIEKS
jgi:predicted HicB family RNase H-like nuclease